MRNILFFGCLLFSMSACAQKGPYSNVFEKSGKIGIGTKHPDELLTVKGSIHAQEVRVDLKGALAPDYVFEQYFNGTSVLKPDYKRMSLTELEVYLENHKHLPKMPSAQAMSEEGVNLKEQHLLLLEKVEELTLYLIEQQKEIETLKSEIKALKK